MQQLLGSLVVSMGVRDQAYKAGMAQARAEARSTGQEFERSGKQMSGAMDRTADAVQSAAHRIVTTMSNVQQKVRAVGIGMTAAVTAPLALAAKVSGDAASDFQSAMGRVQSAMLSADPKQIEALSAAAMKMGPAVGRGATEAAGAIEDLAKNGLSAAEILGGGLAASLTLATVGQTDLGTASDLTTDILSQFNRSAGDLPTIVNKVSGALDVSKLSMDSYKEAIGQAGGVAGGLGYSFDDLNTALAATSSYFDGGSDAGTSFKTFLLALNPQSKQAADAMTKLGISFFDTKGNLVSLGEAAETLKTKLGDLNDRSRNAALTTMFGSDGMRTALALMKAGAKGIADAQAQIDKVTAGQKTAILLDGEAAAADRLASSWAGLKIQVGDAGLIQSIAAIKNGLADVLDRLRDAPPWVYKVATGFGILAAAIGPAILVIEKLATTVLPFVIIRIFGLRSAVGALALGFSALVDPLGTAIALIGRLAVAALGQAALSALLTTVAGLALPLGLAAVAFGALWLAMSRSSQASAPYRSALDAASDANAKAIDTTNRLATAQGKLREELLATARAQMVAAGVERDRALKAAQDARDRVLAARGRVASSQAAAAPGRGIVMGEQGVRAGGLEANSAGLHQANLDLIAARDALAKRQGTVDLYRNGIRTALANPPKPGRDVSFDTAPKGSKGRDDSADASNYAAKLAEVRNAQLDAEADLTGSVRARYRATMAHLDAERADFAHQLQADQGITSAQADTLMAAKDRELATRRTAAEQELSRGLLEQEYDATRERNDVEQELTRGAGELAQTASERRDAALRLLDLQRQQEDADLDLVLATKDSASAEYENARSRKGRLDEIYAQRREQTERDNRGPLASFLGDMTDSAAKSREAMENVAVDGLKGISDGIEGVISGTKSMGAAFADVAKSIIADLARIAIKKAILGPLGNLLGGLLGGGVNLASLASPGLNLSGTSGSLAVPQLDTSSWLTFGGGRAKGGLVSPSQWHIVGENGPEVFVPSTAGTIIPNGGLGFDGGRQRVEIVPSPWFDVRAAGAAEPGIRDMGTRAAMGGANLAKRDAGRARRRSLVTR